MSGRVQLRLGSRAAGRVATDRDTVRQLRARLRHSGRRQGDKGDAGTQGIAGAPGLTNYGPTTASAVSTGKIKDLYPPGTARTAATAKCQPGEKAVGGGYLITATLNGVPVPQTAAVRGSNLNSSKSNAFRNEPTRDGNGWVVTAATTVKSGKSNSSDRVRVTLKVTANCAKVS